MMAVLMEAASRALLVAITVGAGLRVCRVSNVLPQKAAWCLVLAASVAMPLVMRWQFLPSAYAVTLPIPALQVDRTAAPLRLANAPLPSQDGAKLAALPAAVTSRASGVTGDRYPAPVISHALSSPGVQGSDSTAAAVSGERSDPLLHRFADVFAAMRRLSLNAIAIIVYTAVLTILLARMAFGLVAAVGLWMGAEPVIEPFWSNAVITPYAEPVLPLPRWLRSSRNVASPVTIGSGVVLPAEWIEWDREKLRIVLAHERSHVSQGDFYLHLLASLHAAMFWFSPLGWWLKRKLCDLGEAISDRAGLEEAASRTAYAQVLLEFAAMPRPTALGVAMARSGNLSHRIDRLLNEARFRQAFAGSRRILFAVVLVPVALVAATALVRVEAAASGQVAPAPPVPAQAPSPVAAPAVASAPASPTVLAPAAPEPPEAAPEPDAVPSSEAAPAPEGAPAAERANEAQAYGEVHDAADDKVALIEKDQAETSNTRVYGKSKHLAERSSGKGYSYSYDSSGDSYALITDPSGRVTFSGDWNDGTRNTIDKVRKLTNGKFLWFSHDGKSYFIDDQAQIAQIEAMEKPIQELGRQQEEFGKQQEALGRKQEELGEKQEKASIPTPDMSKEMAQLNEAMAKLNAKKGSTISQEELADMEGKLGEIQGRLGELEGRIGEKQGEFGAQQGELGAQQGKLGEEQGRLGEQQGKLAEEADRRIKSMIDASLRNGKAKPIE